jgi:tetraacyldisaccharide 4'-kinase
VASVRNTDKLLLAGIAKPASFFAYLRAANDTTMVFSDHHYFTEKKLQLKEIKDKTVIFTEKDYGRLKDSAIGRNFITYL